MLKCGKDPECDDVVILGIDPGFAKVGYGVIRCSTDLVKILEYGIIETTSDESFGDRLWKVHDEVDDVLERISPDILSIEKFRTGGAGNNSLLVAQARGVIMMAIRAYQVFEFPPSTVKLQVAGKGNADKKTMINSVKESLNIKDKVLRKDDDSMDGLAIALTCWKKQPWKQLTEQVA